MSSSVLNFPNDATKWRPGVSPNPGGKPRGGRVVQRRARELRKAAAVAEILNADKPRFTGDGVDLLIETYKDPTMPLEVRLACATQAAPVRAIEASSGVTRSSASRGRFQMGRRDARAAA